MPKIRGQLLKYANPIAGLNKNQGTVGTIMEAEVNQRERLQGVHKSLSRAFGPLCYARDLSIVLGKKGDDFIRLAERSRTEHDGRRCGG